MRAAVRPLRSSTIAAGCAFKLIELALGAGLDPAALRGIELPPPSANGFETRIPFETQLALWETAVRALRDPGFPIRVASCLRMSDYNVVGFACMTSACLRDALEQAARYQSIWSDATRWDLREQGEAAALAFLVDASPRLGVRCNTECAIAEMVNAARALSGRPLSPREVRFRHARPADTSAHEAFFRSPLRFEAARDEIVFDRSFLALPLVKADADLATFFQGHTEALLRRIARDDSVTARLEALLLQETRRGPPTPDAAARRLGMSSRTLRRRLLEEGTRFQDVLDRARCSLAKRYLEDSSLALGEIAFLLGFSEPSAFHRAFKRWTGRTPLAHRAAREAS